MKHDQAKPALAFMILDPGHFHAALVLKEMLEVVSPDVYVYAPDGPEVREHLKITAGYNARASNPTRWREKVCLGPDYLSRMIAERPGRIVVLAGDNGRKAEYIRASVEAGLNVLADKPMCIDAAGYETLCEAFRIAEAKGVLLYDIMTERSEITTILQKELMAYPEVFGELVPGAPDDPAVVIHSVHHFYKSVSGNPVRRPSWFFDTARQGEGLVDVATHLVDLVPWMCFPGTPVDFDRDIRVLKAERRPTPLTEDEFRRATGLGGFPDAFKTRLENGILPVYANGRIDYRLKGVHVRIAVEWKFQAPEGGGDTHFAAIRGSRSNIVIRQEPEQGNRPELFIEAAPGTDADGLEKGLAAAVRELEKKYHGIALVGTKKARHITVPDKLRVGHEAHFAEVTRRFLQYLEAGRLPDWEIANMKAKYAITTKALVMARSGR